MKLEHIVGLAVRLFSIALAIYILRDGISLVPYFLTQGLSLSLYIYLAFTIFLLSLSVYLWSFPMTVSKRLVVFKDTGETDAHPAKAEEIQVIGFSILGMYLLFNALSDIAYWLTFWFLSSREHGIPMDSPADQIPGLVTTGVELVFALALLFGASGIARIVRKLRYG